ncbi:MAG: class I SAM-dependent methyltransferase [Candidatus Moraniibacteriota bacterium]|nr:MAG: class I SAM-dependent methyltransferase [Candidatus Moranbacteria bacterium]
MREALTESSYWDSNIEKTKLPIKYEYNASLSSIELDRIFKKILPTDYPCDFIELGCAPGGWMYYFHNRFDYNVSGIDFSPKGIEITRKNLDVLGITHELFQGNLDSFVPKKHYDVVFSAGLIEHFHGDTLQRIIQKHIEFTKPGGFIVISVPNLSGWNLFYQKLLNSENVKIHNLDVMNLEFFNEVGNKDALENIYTGYIGRVNFGLYSGKWPFGYIHQAIQNVFNFLFQNGIMLPETKSVSPYILSIYKKRGEAGKEIL